MTWADFKSWLRLMGWSQSEASRQLGIAPNTIGAYKRGQHIPKSIGLACSALLLGASEFRAPENEGTE